VGGDAMKRSLISAMLGVVALALVVVFRGTVRNTVVTSVNRGRPHLDRTGNRTNDIPSRRGELPADMH
jgi:hypothetical protein